MDGGLDINIVQRARIKIGKVLPGVKEKKIAGGMTVSLIQKVV